MSIDQTQQQSSEDQRRSKEMSERSTQPPGKVPGYELQRFLGSGAFGEVWVGIDRTTHRKVAVKFYQHRAGLNWASLEKEVEKLVFLSADRYVVQLLDVGWDADPPFFVMEYIENGSLEDYMQQHGNMPVEDAVEVFREIAIGLSHAHNKGVLHCDLKPANILLDDDHKPRLADFGQSRLTSEQKPALGTLFYMAPEQANLDAVPDVCWDVYSLGAILYCLLTGQPPYRSREAVGTIDSSNNLIDRLAKYRQVIQGAARPTDHHRVPGIDRHLISIIDRCLAARSEDRFGNVQEVLDALQLRQVRKYRRPLMLLGVLGPLVLMAIMGLFAWRGYHEAQRSSSEAVREKAYQSNQFTAQFVAWALEGEIAEYFSIVKEEAQRLPFRAAFQVVSRSPDLPGLANPDLTEEQAEETKTKFLSTLGRKALLTYLEHRLAHYSRRLETNTRAPKFASIFVTDHRGTILAVAYDQETQSRSEGKNYAWRTYFNGLPSDLNRSERPPEGQHIRAPHLSAPFQSTSTFTWKIGISTPIWENADGTGEFLGVMVLTVNVGDFEFMRTEEQQTQDRFAVLIDNRKGDRRGTVLQHPLIKKRPDTDFSDYRVSDQQLAGIAEDWRFNYEDPLAASPVGQSLSGRWIAASEGVLLPENGDAQHAGNTDLIVLVQQREDFAINPVKQLASSLLREALWAVVIVIITIIVLWYFVLRLLSNTHEVIGQATSGTTRLTATAKRTTIRSRT